VNLRTALVLLLCASVGVHAGFKLESLVKMTPQGGLVNTWLYEKEPNGNVLCINTTEPKDPCTDTIDIIDKSGYMQFRMSAGDEFSSTDKMTSAMKVTVTPKAGSSGIMASNSRAADLLNHDKDPMKTIIANGKLDSFWYSVFTTIRKQKDAVMTFSLISNDVSMTYEGKLSVDKISMCYGVTHKFSDPCRYNCPSCDECPGKCKTMRDKVSENNCPQLSVDVTTLINYFGIQINGTIRNTTRLTRRRRGIKKMEEEKIDGKLDVIHDNLELLPRCDTCSRRNGGTYQGSTCASKKAFKVTECRPCNGPSKTDPCKDGTAAWSQNCAPHIMDGLQHAAAQRV